MKKIFITLLLIFVSCTNVYKDVKLEQRIKQFRIIDNTCSLDTSVWTFKYLMVNTLEYTEIVVGPCDKIEARKEVELHKALTTYNIVRKKYLGHGK